MALTEWPMRQRQRGRSRTFRLVCQGRRGLGDQREHVDHRRGNTPGPWHHWRWCYEDIGQRTCTGGSGGRELPQTPRWLHHWHRPQHQTDLLLWQQWQKHLREHCQAEDQRWGSNWSKDKDIQNMRTQTRITVEHPMPQSPDSRNTAPRGPRLDQPRDSSHANHLLDESGSAAECSPLPASWANIHPSSGRMPSWRWDGWNWRRRRALDQPDAPASKAPSWWPGWEFCTSDLGLTINGQKTMVILQKHAMEKTCVISQPSGHRSSFRKRSPSQCT